MNSPPTIPKPTFHPLIRPLDPGLDPVAALRSLFGRLPGTLLMHGAMAGDPRSRFSFLTADPVRRFALASNLANAGDHAKALEPVDKSLQEYATVAVPGLPPFQGGWAGVCSYELGHLFERLPSSIFDPLQLPAIQLGLYDVVIVWDHVEGTATMISQGIPEHDLMSRRVRAEQRADLFSSLLAKDAVPPGRIGGTKIERETGLIPNLQDTGFHPAIKSNFSRDGYLNAVRRCVELIHAGDAFQINLSQQLFVPRSGREPLEVMTRAAMRSGAPFSAWMDLGSSQIVSLSPERLFSIRDRVIESRPIKGTRRRKLDDPAEDQRMRDELSASAKDRAENTMIVDLIRNDLSRICTDDSIAVTQWCGLETFSNVHHLVSAVEGKLRDEVLPSEVLKAIFPGGSVTGAPRIRAMEIICELEKSSRGAYCGSIGYFGLSGDADWNILIRTMTAKGDWWQLPVGGGIVADSDPALEYAETWDKAAGMLDALGLTRQGKR